MVSRWLIPVATYWLATVAALLILSSTLMAQQALSGAAAHQQPPPGETGDMPVIRSTTTLVFLNVTVLDKKGHPVVKGLTKEDFSITEDKKPQRIFSFEEPEVHLGNGADAQVPQTVLVLDLLNTSFEDFAYVRDQAAEFLLNQPEELRSRTELMVVGNPFLGLLQGCTRSRKDLLFALYHLPAIAPYKLVSSIWEDDRIRQSYIALQQIAAQNRGMPGRKNVTWIGRGSPAFGLTPATAMINGAVMQRTLDFVFTQWDRKTTWGWDYPMMAMTAARLGRPDQAIDALFIDTPKNRYLPNGHNFQQLPELPLYLPGNGGLLFAVGMMAAGWKGSPATNAPGFPNKENGWSVRHEGLRKAL